MPLNLFKSYKIIDKDRIRLLDGLVNKFIFDFKVFIWEYRNVKLADLEHQKGINAKMKKLANKSKFVVNKLDKIIYHDKSPLISTGQSFPLGGTVY
ncbi:hypothetical protein RhiirA5_444355 [Rhizophagus irregularis]|uniref:Uncharacterized protein n=1 Tax=Rhizophagus irregularis TaxID=588596 RepID=A0A2N0ND62_9GLOM|nr:hypothetical protein RhiirA5_444355 [Rhizophagus irregularis]